MALTVSLPLKATHPHGRLRPRPRSSVDVGSGHPSFRFYFKTIVNNFIDFSEVKPPHTWLVSGKKYKIKTRREGGGARPASGSPWPWRPEWLLDTVSNKEGRKHRNVVLHQQMGPSTRRGDTGHPVSQREPRPSPGLWGRGGQDSPAGTHCPAPLARPSVRVERAHHRAAGQRAGNG